MKHKFAANFTDYLHSSTICTRNISETVLPNTNCTCTQYYTRDGDGDKREREREISSSSQQQE